MQPATNASIEFGSRNLDAGTLHSQVYACYKAMMGGRGGGGWGGGLCVSALRAVCALIVTAC